MVEILEDEVGMIEEVLGNENDVLESAIEILWDELEVAEDGNKVLGWNGCLGKNEFVEWSVVEIMDEVAVNKDEPTDSKRLVSKWLVEGLGV